MKWRCKRIVAIDTDAAMEVGRGERDALAAERGPVLRDRRLLGRVHTVRQAPQRLPRSQADRFRIDERVGSAVPDGLE